MSETRRASSFVPKVLIGLFVVALAGFGVWQLVRAEVSLTTEPAGALVRLDGETVGRTPTTLSPAPGRHRIDVSLAGYAPVSMPVDLARGDREALALVLERGVGTLELLSNPREAWVEIDGERVDGVTPLTIEHATGSLEIAIGREERRTQTQTVLLEDGATTRVRVELARDPHGSLTVRTAPTDARVRLPELAVDYEAGMRVPVGSLSLEVERAGYAPRRETVSIVPGDNRPRIELTPLRADFELRLEPSDARASLRWRSGGGGHREVDGRARFELPVGQVRIVARAPGHRTTERSVEHGAQGTVHTLALERIAIDAGAELRDALRSGGTAPVMIVLPPGRFVMGDDGGAANQRPAHTREFTQPFAVSRDEVTVADYERFARATGREVDERAGEADVPVRYVDHDSAVAYAQWLSQETGERYRLPTEAEWEYAARGGSSDPRWFGDAALCEYANLADASTGRRYGWDVADCDDGFETVAPVGQFPANPFGLRDVLGNVAEWVQECGMPDYARAGEDGTRVLTGPSCSMHGTRGGSWDGREATLSASRRASSRGQRDDVGIRLVREL